MRWIVRIFVALVVACVLLVGLVFMLPAERIGAIASAQLEKATGRTLTLSGGFSPSFYPTLGLKTGPVTISNADWAGEAPMIEASSASVGVGFAALFGGDIEVKSLVLQDPVIRLARGADGQANWEFGSESADSASAERSGSFSLEDGDIRNGRVIYEDLASGQRIDISAIDMDIALPKAGQRASVVGSAEWDARKIGYDLAIGDLGALTSGNGSDVKGMLKVGDASLALDGQVALKDAPKVTGFYRVKLPDVADVAFLAALPNSLSAVDVEGRVELSDSGLVATTMGRLHNNGIAVGLDGSLRGLRDWGATQDLRVTAKVNAKDVVTANFMGGVNVGTGALNGDVTADVRDLARLGVLASGTAFELPKGLGNSGDVSGQLSLAGDRIDLSEARITLGQNTLSGRVRAELGVKPYVSANLTGRALDISGFTSSSSGGDRAGGTGWSKEPLRLSGLDAVNADISLNAQSVNIGVTQLGRVNIDAKLNGGVLSTTLNEVVAFSGVMTGNVALSGRGGLSMDSNVRANDMRLEQLLGSIIDFKRLTGKGDARLNLSSTGDSLHAVMNSLSGDGSLNIADGAILGIDLAAMMRNLQKAFGGFEGATEFTSLSGTFEMQNGVLTNTDMELVSPLFKALGTGRVDIGGQSMNYRVTPSRLSGDAEVSVPVDITGPWGNLRFKPDLAGLVSLLGDEAVGEKVQEELDRVKKVLDNPEEVIKDKLKDEVLGRLGLRSDTPVEAGSAQAPAASPLPRVRPADLDTTQVVEVAPVVEEPVTDAPKPIPQTREEVEDVVKEKVEDELKKLLLRGLSGG